MLDRSSRPHRSPRQLDPAHRAADHQTAGHPPLGTGPDRLPPRSAPLDGAPDPARYRLPAADLDRPGHRDPDPCAHEPLSRNATYTTRPVTWSTSTSRSSAGSPTAAASGFRSGSTGPRPRHDEAARAGARLRGYAYLHHAVDDHSRLAYSEILADERKETAAGFWRRARAFFASHGITVRRVLTDNGACYRSMLWATTLAAATDQAQADPPLPAPDQRQGRTLQPHPARGMGLRPRLPLRNRTRGHLPRLAPPLQSPPRPHRTQGQVTSLTG